jgi:hypothetical protein
MLGFSMMFWGVSEPSVGTALSLSGAALTTEGFLAPKGAAQNTLYIIGGIIGLGIVGLLITFLPTIYSIYSQREQEVSDQRRRRKCVRQSGKETHAVKVGFQVR